MHGSCISFQRMPLIIETQAVGSVQASAGCSIVSSDNISCELQRGAPSARLGEDKPHRFFCPVNLESKRGAGKKVNVSFYPGVYRFDDNIGCSDGRWWR